jgi:HPt (histidine-containing phosphotransfer) domain-containing protein
MPIQHPLIDLSYINEISGGDEGYIREVVGIFVDTMASGMPKLTDLIRNSGDFDSIQKQAHFLKSSAGIIKITGVYDNLVKIDLLSKQRTGLDEIKQSLNVIITNYNEALPFLIAGRS